MQVRKASYKDAPSIKLLLENLGYRSNTSLLINQLENLFSSKDHQAFVCELNKEILGFVSVHYLPQLAFDGGLMLITYLSVDETSNEQGVAEALEEQVVKLARSLKCERIQVHCAEWRTAAHHFYEQQHYQEYPKYFTKRLIYGE